jgi:hypothetical protein
VKNEQHLLTLDDIASHGKVDGVMNVSQVFEIGNPK